MRIKLSIAIILVILSCKSPEDFKNLCDVSFIFTKDNKNQINFDLIVNQVFQPYCASCHTSQSFLNNPSKRDGYLPLDESIKTQLSGNFEFYNLFANYINFKNPSESILVQVTQEAGINRTPYSGIVEFKEPRNRCNLPDDVKQGLIWWIEKANGSIENLFN